MYHHPIQCTHKYMYHHPIQCTHMYHHPIQCTHKYVHSTTTHSDLEAQLALEKSHEPTSPLVPDTGDEEVDVVSGGNQEEEEDEGMLVDKKDAEYVTECECEGVEYQIGDVVYVRAR